MTALKFRTALLWSASSGALALTWELCWSRLMNYASAGQAEAFGLMLGFYLLGLAIGSWGSTRWFGALEAPEALSRVARLVVAANVIAFLIAPLAAWLYTALPASVFVVRFVTMVPVAVSGVLFGVVFPLLCHWAVASGRFSGRDVSYLYVANIVGAGAGSLLTGFLLFDYLGLATLTVVVLVVGHLWAEWLAGGRLPHVWRVVPLVVALASPVLTADLYERLFYKQSWTPDLSFPLLLESRHGVIAVTPDATLIGNGVYDSVIHDGLNPTPDHVRPYWLGAVHAAPRDVLVIGLASGTWTHVMANHPSVQTMTAVEISAGYLDLVAARPEVSSLLRDPRVTLEVDDGRRWLRNHPERQFDVIMWNTYHWREMSTGILSIEFLELVKSRLKPGGIALWNTTGSGRVVATGLQAFPHMVKFGGFVVGSMTPIDLDWDRWATVLAGYRIDGRPAFDQSTPEGVAALQDALALRDRQGTGFGSYYWLDHAQLMAAHGHEAIITDDNLGREYRRWQDRFRR